MKKFLFSSLFLFVFVSTFSQSNYWEKSIEKTAIENVTDQPTEFKQYNLTLNKLKDLLFNAPLRASNTSSSIIIELPNEFGKIKRYQIFEVPIFHPDLANKYPNIKSFVGNGIDNNAVIRLSFAPSQGINVAITNKNRPTTLIKPINVSQNSYAIYSRNKMSASDISDFECETIAELRNSSAQNSRNPNDGFLRKYRLAISTTAEFSQFWLDGTETTDTERKGKVLAALNTSLTRINGIFERDFSVSMELIANNDQVVYLNAATDPYSGVSNSILQNTLDNVIGDANYDVGHLVHFEGARHGNAGCIACICTSGSKGSGWTGHPDPASDDFNMIVSHEMGHQFGGYHIQSSSNCRSSAGLQEVEPGSGSTIMGYAGICPANVQSFPDDYFNYVDIRDIIQWTRFDSSCAQLIPSGNSEPTANAGNDYTIPKSTAFKLEGIGNDLDGDLISFCWEENDPENPNSSQAPSPTRTQGPMFRSKLPVGTPNRYIPQMDDILAGNLTPTWEVLPAIGRTMDIRFTVRDNATFGPQTASDEMTLTVDGNSGPFQVTSQSTPVSWDVGTSVTVNWNVANTNLAPINTSDVSILLSTDGGYTYPHVLVANAINDGSETFTLPNVPTSANSRVMVKANNNIYFAINAANINVQASEFLLNFNEINVDVCQPNDAIYNFTYTTFLGFNETTTFSANNLPVGTNINFNPTSATTDGTNVQVTISNTQNISVGNYTFEIVGTAPSVTRTSIVSLNTFDQNLTIPTLTFPSNGQTTIDPNEILTWNQDINAASYDIEIATDNAFTSIIESANVTQNQYQATNLTFDTEYFWRVKTNNTCGSSSFSNAFSFTTFCIAPSNVIVSNVLLDSAEVNWTENGNATAWEIEVVLNGNTPTGVGVSAPTNPFTITNLNSSTDYIVYVRSSCGSGNFSDWTVSSVFTTAADFCSGDHFYDSGGAGGNYSDSENIVTTIVPSAGFNSVTVSFNSFFLESGYDYLRVYDGPDTNSSLLGNFSGTTNPGSFTSSHGTGTLTFRFTSDGSVTYSGWDATVTCINITCPSPYNFTANTVTTNSAELNWVNGNTETNWEIEYGLQGFTLGTGTLIQTTTNPHFLTGLSSATDYDVYLRANCGANPGIDDSGWVTTSFTTLVSCPEPTNLTVDNITFQSANINWVNGNTETNWEIEYGLQGFTLGTGTLTQTTSNPYTLTGLNTATNYDVYLRANCGVNPGDDDSVWVGPVSFTTACNTFTAPFLETFTSSFSMPNCWTESGSESWNFSTGAAYQAQNAGDHTVGGGTNYAWIDGSIPNGPNQISTLLSPFIDVSTLTTPLAEFSVYSYNTDDNTYNTLDVELFDGVNWNNLLHIQNSNNGWTTYQYILTNFTITGPIQLRFTIAENSPGSPYFNDILIDDVAIYEAPTCPDPSNLIANNETPTSVDLNWNNGNTETAWQIEYGITGFTQGTGTVEQITSNPYTIVGLSSETNYDVYLKANCGINPGDDDSNWIGPVSFTTLISCPKPTNVTVNNITFDTAAINWVAGSTETNWEIEYGLNGFVLGTGVLNQTLTTNFALTGLTFGSSYDVYVSANCGVNPGDDDSLWVGPLSFNTLDIETPLNLTAAINQQNGEVNLNWQEGLPGLNETFDDGIADNWIPVTGNWSVAGGTYNVTGSSVSSSYYDADFSNFEVEVKMRKINGSASNMALYFNGDPTSINGVNDWNNGYALHYTTTGDWQFVKIINGSWTSIDGGWSFNPDVNPNLGSWNILKVTYADGFIDVHINGTLQGSYFDDTFLSGKIGLKMYDQPTGSAEFDYITVNNLGRTYQFGNINQPETRNVYANSNCTNDSQCQGEIIDTVLAPTPPTLNYTYTGFGTRAFLNYNVYRDGVNIGTTTNTNYLDTLTIYGTYDYYVTALYDEGESSPSNTVTVVYEGVPNITVNPTALFETLPEGGQSTQTLTITNTGDADLDFEITTIDLSRFGNIYNNSNENTNINSIASIPTTVSTFQNNYNAVNNTNVLIFRNNLAWGLNVNVTLLEALGAVVSISPSSDMGTIDLNLFDLIVFESDQPNSFYNSYVNNISRFENYLNTGGVIQFHCATQSSARIPNLPFPGGLQTLNGIDIDTNNFIVDFTHPLVNGLSNPLIGNNASHEGLENIPNGATIITENESGIPTTVEYSYGSGRIIVTGMTWEHANGNGFNSGDILPNAFVYSLDTLSAFWLSTNPLNGTVPSGSSIDINVNFDATNLLAGTYNANIDISSNNPNQPIVTVPVELIVTPPSCPRPTNFVASNITSSTIDLSWLAGNTETAWQIEYGITGFTQGTGTIVPVSTNPYTLTSLNSNTDYDVYLRANCGVNPGDDDSVWVGPINFLTLIDYCNGDHFYDSGGEFNNYTDGEDITTTIGPSIGFSSISVEFNSFLTESCCDYLRIYDGPDATFPLLGQFQGSTNPGIFTATNSSGELTFVFHSDGSVTGSGWDATITCVNITCPNPTNFNATNVTDTSVDLNWTNGGSETNWQIEYGIAGFTQGAGTTLAVSTNPYNLTGLNVATNYEVYLKANCGANPGDDDSGWVGPIAFTTSCDIYPTPFEEIFETFTTPECWNESGSEPWNYNTFAGYQASNAGDHTVGGGTNYAWIDGSLPNGPGQISNLHSPWLDVSNLNNPTVQYAIYSYNTDDSLYNTLNVIIHDSNGVSSTIQTLQNSTNGWQVFTFDLTNIITSNTIKVEFIIEENSPGIPFYNDILIDDIKVDDYSVLNNEDFTVYGFNYFPNPTSDYLNLTANQFFTEVKVYSLLGQEIIAVKPENKTELQIDLSQLSSGTYIVRVNIENKTKIIKVVKK